MMSSPVGKEAEASQTTTPNNTDMEKILHKLLGAIQDEIDIGCKHCAEVLASAFAEEDLSK